MTPELLIETLAAVLAFAFGYFPWLKDKFDNVPTIWKPILNAGLLLVVAMGLVGLKCGGFVDYFSCDQAGVVEALKVWFQALLINQFVFAVGVNLPKKVSRQLQFGRK